MKIAEYKKLLDTKKCKSKYGNKKTVVDGITFSSKKEADDYCSLLWRVKAGEITNLTLQPRFILQESFIDSQGKKHRAIEYVADFQFEENRNTFVIDSKGMETDVFKIKLKLFLKRYPELCFVKY